MQSIADYLSNRPYPGRGILAGVSADGKRIVGAYFIMGRSENSRNRIFEATSDGIRTAAFDPSKMTDPSLIIYHPVRQLSDATLVVTNGDQTDTIAEGLAEGASVYDALHTRTFEPDEPNWTPRVSLVVSPNGSLSFSILKSDDGDSSSACRFFYDYETPLPGASRFISTYEGFKDPLPTFSGEPVKVNMPEGSPEEIAREVWNALDEDNRVSLYAFCVDRATGDLSSYIINKYE